MRVPDAKTLPIQKIVFLRSLLTPAGFPVLILGGLITWGGGQVSNPARADALKSRLQAVEQDLSKNLERRDELNRAAERTATELKEIQNRGIGLARSLYLYSAKADSLQTRLRQLQEQERSKSAAMAREHVAARPRT